MRVVLTQIDLDNTLFGLNKMQLGCWMSNNIRIKRYYLKFIFIS